MADLDEIDNKLIKLLERDAWQRSRALAKILNISEPTLRRRLRRLIQKGVLRAVAIVDSGTVNLPLTVMIAIDIGRRNIVKTTQALSRMSEIIWCSSTTGRFSVIFLAQFPSMDKLHEYLGVKLSAIGEIKNIEMFICVDVEKGRHLVSID